jgi:SAM-dependent methyltransferase
MRVRESCPGFTWPQAIEWLRAQPDRQELVRQCYFDEPVELAAERFEASEEWAALRALLEGYLPGHVLDLGAGRGISSYAFARAGCTVVAVEPDTSDTAGAAAIARISAATGARIEVLAEEAEQLSAADARFRIVYGRAVLHHARDLKRLCAEAARVLEPGGVFCATREHVLSRREDLQTFLDRHPLHFLYGGEHAYTLDEYVEAIESAGLRIQRVIGPYQSVVNYAPTSLIEFESVLAMRLQRMLGPRAARRVARTQSAKAAFGWWRSARDQTPGRHYSFLAAKPG